MRKKYPGNIKIFKTSDLNTQKNVKGILDFCGIPKKDQRKITRIKENKLGDKTFGRRYTFWRANKI